MAYLDKAGLTYLWGKIKSSLSAKADLVDGKVPVNQLPTSFNADTVDGKHIVVSSYAPTSNDTSVVTIVI